MSVLPGTVWMDPEPMPTNKNEYTAITKCSELLVLYHSKKSSNTWCVYAGGTEEADQEFDLMSESDDTLEEKARIWINKGAEVIFYGV